MALDQFQKRALERRLGPAPSVMADQARADAMEYLRNAWRGDRVQPAAARADHSVLPIEPRPLLNEVSAQRLREGLKSSVPTAERARHDALGAITDAWRNRPTSPTPSRPTPAAQGFGGRSAPPKPAVTRVENCDCDDPPKLMTSRADGATPRGSLDCYAIQVMDERDYQAATARFRADGCDVSNHPATLAEALAVCERGDGADRRHDARAGRVYREDNATTEAKQRTDDARERFLSWAQSAWKQPRPAPVDAR